MAQDFVVVSNVRYANLDGDRISVFDGSSTIGGTATDDGTWNVGDPMRNGNPFLFEGHYVDNGATFLVFDSGTETIVWSPSAPSTAPGYPLNSSALPPLTTSALGVCFALGTLIAMPDGASPVEELRIGDSVLTADGRQVPVKWIGRQTLHKVFTPRDRFAPVRIKAGALGNGVPHADLVVTADHALIIDGFAINAGVLVNGTTIVRDAPESLPAQVTYYHIETDAHDVVLANGAPAETYVDYVQRRAFDNYAEYLELYGEERTIAEMPAPRISTARLLPESIRARLAADTAA